MSRRAAPGLLAAVVLLTACGGSPKAPRDTRSGQGAAATATPTPRPPTDAELIQRLLARRATALRQDRPGAYAATTRAGARTQARQDARHAAGLGLEDPRYEIERLKVDDGRARIKARLAYGIRGVAGDFGSTRTLLASRTGGRWRIDRAIGSRDREPWEVEDYDRVQTPHFVVWTPPGIPAPESALQDGYARLRSLLAKGRLRRRYLVVIARDATAARELTRKIAGLESLTALTDTQVRIGGPAEAVQKIRSQRLIIVQSGFAVSDAATQAQIVTHELTHAALAPVTSGRTPGWLVEGVALYVSGDDRRAEYAALTTVPTLAGLSAPDSISQLDEDTQRAAYATASDAAFTIAERYGQDALLRLYLVFGRTSLRGRRGDPELTARAVRRVLGVGLDSLQQSLG